MIKKHYLKIFFNLLFIEKMNNTKNTTNTTKNVKVIENVKNSELTNEQIKAMYKEIRKSEKEQKQQKKAINKENHLKRVDLKNEIKRLREIRKNISLEIKEKKAQIKSLRD